MAQPSQNTEKAFLKAYDEYADAIFRFCMVKVSDRERALDLTQDTFTRVWEYSTKGNEISNWKPFLFRTAHNLIIDYYRKKKSVSLDEMEEEVGFLPSETAGIPAEVYAEYNIALQKLNELDETYRDPVMLRVVEGLSPRDIAETLGISENVVSVRVHRGVAKLREIANENRKK